MSYPTTAKQALEEALDALSTASEDILGALGLRLEAMENLELAQVKGDLHRWLEWSGADYPDDSPGTVIAADADGTIMLDDSVTVWNPLRGLEYLIKRLEAEVETRIGMIDQAQLLMQQKELEIQSLIAQRDVAKELADAAETRAVDMERMNDGLRASLNDARADRLELRGALTYAESACQQAELLLLRERFDEDDEAKMIRTVLQNARRVALQVLPVEEERDAKA